MAEYKLYCLDEEGRIMRRHEFVASGDEPAMELASNHFPDFRCELWNGTRKVAVIPAHRPVA